MSGTRLFYVVGASGVGKDSLIRYARQALGSDQHVVFAHRYITRPTAIGAENHIALNESEFLLRKRHGLFAMDWESHGVLYGVGIEVETWLAKGLTVVVNGSRRYISTARMRYPGLNVVWISARPELIAARLAARGRESPAQIVARLKRNARLGFEPRGASLHIRNEGPIEAAGRRLLALLSGERPLL